MTVDVNQINIRLRLHYGCNLLKMPFFRLVFSDRQTESRFGTFAEYYGKVFLREYTGIREMPKYGYLKGKWILERWLPPNVAYTPEVPSTVEGSYEPLYVFQDANGNALEINEEFMNMVIYNLLHPALPGDRKSKLRTEEEESARKEIRDTEDVLESQGRSWIGNQLHSREAITVPEIKEK